jgi:hypothetical protein
MHQINNTTKKFVCQANFQEKNDEILANFKQLFVQNDENIANYSCIN